MSVAREFMAVPDEHLRFLDHGIKAAWQSIEDLQIHVGTQAMMFHERQAEERSRLRHEIMRRHERIHGGRNRVKTSQVYLQVDAIDGLEMRWRRRKRAVGHPNLMAAARLPVEVPKAMLLRGAHEDEIELMMAHYREYLRIREEWAFAMDLRRTLRGRMLVTLNLLDREGRWPRQRGAERDEN